jgi:hypothetical protein
MIHDLFDLVFIDMEKVIFIFILRHSDLIQFYVSILIKNLRHLIL